MDPADKSFAMGIMETVFSLFGKFYFFHIKHSHNIFVSTAFTPYPLIFGAIIDSTCMIWEKSCGKTGNCWLYDLEKFRVYLHVSSFIFLMLGVLCETAAIFFTNNIRDLYDDEEQIEMKQINNNNNDSNQ